jgi:DNA-binding transcriptional MerR regulator
VRIAELSRYSGVTAPTIKFYVREGLLPPGELTSPNQAQYGDEHLRRLKLIRALVDLGGLSIAAAKEVLAAVDDPEPQIAELLGRARGVADDSADRTSAQAASVVDDLIARLGWASAAGAARNDLVNVVATIQELGLGEVVGVLDGYAEAAARVAAADVAAVQAQDARGDVQAAAILAVLGGRMFESLRSLAHDAARSGRIAAGGDGNRTPADE